MCMHIIDPPVLFFYKYCQALFNVITAVLIGIQQMMPLVHVLYGQTPHIWSMWIGVRIILRAFDACLLVPLNLL